MKVDKDSIRHVLALFDPEDVPYIQSDNLLKGLMEEKKEESSSENVKSGIVKVKKIGDRNDRYRK